MSRREELSVGNAMDKAGKRQLMATYPIALNPAAVPQGEPLEGNAGASDAMVEELSDQYRLEQTEALIQEHHAVVYRYAYRLARSHSEAEDIAQEVFLRAFKSLHQLRKPEAAKGWLLVIARNEYLRLCQRRGSVISLDQENSPEPPLAKVQCGAEQLENEEWIHVALDRLTEDYRLVVLLYYFEDLTYAEIAAQLSIPIGTVMSRLNRAKKLLKRELGNHLTQQPTD